MEEKKKRLIIIDSNSVIHRAYHALPTLTTQKGEPVNAVYGFLLVFFKAVKEFQPDYIAAAFDLPGPTFRHKKFEEYKGKRPKAPEELYQQIPKVKELLKDFNVPVFEKEGFEADDLIATISEKAPRKQVYPGLEVYILSGDLDALQLVTRHTKIYTLGRGIKETIIYDKERVQERFGLLPEQLIDFKALAGDPSDNIPGASGIGKKIATELLQKYGSIENLYQTIEKGEAWDMKPRLREILFRNKEQVFISKGLATSEKNVPLDFKLEECGWRDYNKEKVKKNFEELNFYSLINRLPELEKHE